MPAIHQVWQICPDDEIVLVFGDGSIYQYPGFRTGADTTILSQIHGRTFNRPGIRRPKYPRPTQPYERLGEVPAGALLIYEEPPYYATAELPTCDILPAFLHFDSVWNAWSQENFTCQLSDFSQDDPDNYTAGGCQGIAFLTNFGSFWRFDWTTDLGTVRVQSQGASPVGTYDLSPNPFWFGTTMPTTVEMLPGPS